MKRLLAATACAVALALPVAAAGPKQELTINRSSGMERVSGLVVQGNSIVLVYGAPGMAGTNEAVKISPEGQRIRVTYDTAANLGVNINGIQPAMMLGPSGGQFPVYNMGSQGSN